MVLVTVSQDIKIPREYTKEQFCNDAEAGFGSQMNTTFRDYLEKEVQRVGKRSKKILPDEFNSPFVDFSREYTNAIGELCSGFERPKPPETKDEVQGETILGDIQVVKDQRFGNIMTSPRFKKEILTVDDFNKLMQDVPAYEPDAFITSFIQFSKDDAPDGIYDRDRALVFFQNKFRGWSAENKKIYIRDVLEVNGEIQEIKSVPAAIDALALSQRLIGKEDITTKSLKLKSEKTVEKQKQETTRKQQKQESKKKTTKKKSTAFDRAGDLPSLDDEFDFDETKEVETDDIILGSTTKSVPIKATVGSSAEFKKRILNVVENMEADDNNRILSFLSKKGKKGDAQNVIINHVHDFADKNNCYFDREDLMEMINTSNPLKRYYTGIVSHEVKEVNRTKFRDSAGRVNNRQFENAIEDGSPIKDSVDALASILEATNTEGREVKCLEL